MVLPGPQVPDYIDAYNGNYGLAFLSQGCRPASLYSPQSYQTPNAGGMPFIFGYSFFVFNYIPEPRLIDPYGGVVQPSGLRTISSQIDPVYRAKNDTFEFNADYTLAPELTLTSQTGYNKDFLYSTEDFNRYNTTPNFLQDNGNAGNTFIGQDNLYCDPQFGCSSRFLAVDRSSETARQFYQELRLTSDFKGNFNFVLGGNYTNYATSEDYYVFSKSAVVVPGTNKCGHWWRPAWYRCAPYSVRCDNCQFLQSATGHYGVAWDIVFWTRLRLYRPQPDRQGEWAGTQLLREPQSLSAQIMGDIRRGLLSGRAGCEIDRRLALHR